MCSFAKCVDCVMQEGCSWVTPALYALGQCVPLTKVNGTHFHVLKHGPKASQSCPPLPPTPTTETPNAFESLSDANANYYGLFLATFLFGTFVTCFCLLVTLRCCINEMCRRWRGNGMRRRYTPRNAGHSSVVSLTNPQPPLNSVVDDDDGIPVIPIDQFFRENPSPPAILPPHSKLL